MFKKLKYIFINYLLKMEILKTSQLLKVMHEDDEDFDVHNFNYQMELDILFNMFASNRRLNINLESVKKFLETCKILYRKELFKKFEEPSVKEYFCQQLNYLLLFDFIISFNSIENKTFNVKNITTKSIFEFFVKLGDFFNFMNFLDVDESFTKYIKIMLTLYLIQLDRDIIEKHFGNIISLLDEFFVNDIVIKVFETSNYENFESISSHIKNLNTLFKDELKNYNSNIKYLKQTEVDLNQYFTANCEMSLKQNVFEVKKKLIEVPNPRPPPLNNNWNANNELYNGMGYDSDSDDDWDMDRIDYGSDSDDDYHWTPTIKKRVPAIDKSDPNFNNYITLFLFQVYQKEQTEYNQKVSNIKELCKGIKIKDYSSFANRTRNINYDLNKVKTILGIDFIENINDFFKVKNKDRDYRELKYIYRVACEYGHFNIAIKYMDFFMNFNYKNKDKIKTEIRYTIEHAFSSPNRSIIQYLIKTYSNISEVEKELKYYSESNIIEPSICFSF